MKPHRWQRLKIWCKRLAFVLVTFVTLIALVLAIEGYRAKKAWDADERVLAARGESLDWQRHVAPPAPDDQNLLATPLLADHFGFGIDTSASDERATSPHAPNVLRRISDWVIQLGGPGDWRKGTVVPLTEWQEKLSSVDNSRNTSTRAELARRSGITLPDEADENRPASALSLLQSRPPASAVNDLRFLLGLHQAELDEIRAAARRPYAQLSLEPTAALSESFMARLGHLKVLTWPFVVSAWTELTADNPEAALVDIETALALSEAAVSQPLLITALVRFALIEAAVSPIWAGLAERRWEDAQLAHLVERLDQVNVTADMQRCLRGERVFALTLLTAAPGRVDAKPGLGSDEFEALSRAMRWWPRAFLYRNQINVARAYQELLIDPIDPTGPSIRMHESEEDRASRAQYDSWSPYNFFAPMLLSALDRSLEKAVASQATVTLARVACALERHRLANAQYPEMLEELVPDFLPRVPPDPVNGGPLRYRRDDAGQFILYSIGLNQQDDGGVPAVVRRGLFGRDAPSGDWVWRSHPVAVGDMQGILD